MKAGYPLNAISSFSYSRYRAWFTGLTFAMARALRAAAESGMRDNPADLTGLSNQLLLSIGASRIAKRPHKTPGAPVERVRRVRGTGLTCGHHGLCIVVEPGETK